jgi:porin
VTVFGCALRHVSGRTIQDHFLEFGLLSVGAFRSRSRDSIAFVFTDQQFSELARQDVRAADEMAGEGHGDGLSRHQFMMELAYGVALARGLRVSPNLQAIINPDRLSDPLRITHKRNVVVVGLKFTYSLTLPNLSGRTGLGPVEEKTR